MLMAVMHIGIVRMRVLDGLVNVRMGMRFLSIPVGIVRVLMVSIVNMPVLML